jgi:CRISPR system Cascade subunit CasB
MTAFIDWLQRSSERDTRVRAVLRRSLAFDPGTHPPAYPYVEPFLQDDDTPWRRGAHYIVGGLWALHWRQDRSGPALPIGRAIARYAQLHHTREQLDKGDSSTERRFVALLDADAGQLPHRLRQMVALLKDETLDFGALLPDLLRWHDPRKPVQQQWARDFYRAPAPEAASDTHSDTSATAQGDPA